MKILVTEATADQVRAFAQTSLGLDIHHLAGKPNILAKMRQSGWDSDHIEAPEPVKPKAAVPKSMANDLDPALFISEEARGRPLTAEEMAQRDAAVVEIVINATEAENEETVIKLQLNGNQSLLVERGKRSKVRWPYLVALENAKRSVAIVDPKTKEIVGWRDVYAYPFTVISGPRPAVSIAA